MIAKSDRDMRSACISVASARLASPGRAVTRVDGITTRMVRDVDAKMVDYGYCHPFNVMLAAQCPHVAAWMRGDIVPASKVSATIAKNTVTL